MMLGNRRQKASPLHGEKSKNQNITQASKIEAFWRVNAESVNTENYAEAAETERMLT
jgi:hypothetical protein